ncbi:MFS transporter [Bacillus sp. BP-3]|uniref:MFS transporter n=1 Tax=Bacillus sp. BP-3 TaxID=3022773 RepID=UPI00232BDFDA|nr:MFS transporter [Bacillus sp. BP-3]MDC2865497.1 MFS transporter [Bacillus sp. BP-3]
MEGIAEYKEYSPKLFRNKSFLLIVMATGFSSLGASIFLFTQTWYIVKFLNLGAAVGWVMIGSSIPQMLFLFVGGVLADHWNKSKIMLWSDFIRTILVGSIVLVFILFTRVPLIIFITYAFLFGILNAFFYPARDSVIPLIVGASQLSRASSIIYTTNQLTVIAGPVIGGILIGKFSYIIAFAFVSSMLLISTIMVAITNIQHDQEKSVQRVKIGTEMREGIKYLRQSNVLLSLVLISILVNFLIVGPLFMGLPIFVDTVLNGEAFDYSFLEGSLSIGLFIGSIIMVLLNVKKQKGTLILILLMCLSISFIIFSKSTKLWYSIIMLFLVGTFTQMIIIPVIGIIQSYTKKQYLGRIMSLLTLASMGLTPLSYGLTSVLIMYNIGISNIIFWSGISLFVLSIVFYSLRQGIRHID